MWPRPKYLALPEDDDDNLVLKILIYVIYLSVRLLASAFNAKYTHLYP